MIEDINIKEKLEQLEAAVIENVEELAPLKGDEENSEKPENIQTPNYSSVSFGSCSCNGFCGGNFRYEGCSCNGYCGSNSRKD